MLNVAVFGSGRGSNFQAILQSIDAGRLPGVRIVLVISNNSSSGILELAHACGIPGVQLSEKRFADSQSFINAMLALLRDHGVTFIALAGYMKRVPSQVIAAYRGRIVNIHPALLPKFGGQGMYGIHVHEAVLAAHESVSGATVHLVDEEYDRGPIVLQRTVPVRPDDTPETLAARVLNIEHELYPEALRLFAEGAMPPSGGASRPQRQE